MLVAADPLNRLRYVVINSGHTFGAKDFRGTNALLYPRWRLAVFWVDEGSGDPMASGFFNERWARALTGVLARVSLNVGWRFAMARLSSMSPEFRLMSRG